jgi:uncharacterized protein
MKKIARILTIIFGLIIISGFLACLFFLSHWTGRENIYFLAQPNFVIRAELARTPVQWERGLMFRKSLPADSGMLFIFPNEALRSFWMKNTLIPLDMIFISSDNKIVDIKNNFSPCTAEPCPVYQSTAPAQYVLEVNAGITQDKRIKIGENIVYKK